MEDLTAEQGEELEKTQETIPDEGNVNDEESFTESNSFSDEENLKEEENPKKIRYDKQSKKFIIGKLKISRKLIIILLIIIAIIGSFMGCSAYGRKKLEEAMAPKDVTVERRTVSKKVTGSSVIKPKDSYSIMTITTGEVTADFINEGDTVQKGDKLYQFDSETPQNSVDSAENSLKKAQQNYTDAVKAKSQNAKTNDKTIKSAQLAVEKAQRTYNDAVNNSYIKSDINGTVGEVFVNSGDNIASGSKIATVYSDRYMKVQIPFNETDAENISVGDGATVTISGTGNELWGSVTSVSGATVATEGHNMVRYVTIELENPGALTTTDKATAIVGNVACNDAGQLEYINEHTICAEASGKISNLNISANDAVYNGQTIATLDTGASTSDVRNAKLSLDDATLSLERAVIASDEYSQDSQISSAKLSLDDARLALEKAQKGLNDYTITAPISGKVVTKNSKAGDKIDSSNSTTPMCIIYDMSNMQFDIDVDEVDVASVKVGQEVTIKADAIENQTFKGVVEKVSVNGVSTNGVTNYPVTITITEYGNLLPGMNIDAEIIVEQVTNTLAIPVSSLNRGNTVYVKGDKENEEDTAPEGYKTVEVVTGISDDNYIEIKSGLTEGTEVRGEELDLTSDLQKMMQAQMQGGGVPDDGGPNGDSRPGGGGQGGAPHGGGSGGGSGGGM